MEAPNGPRQPVLLMPQQDANSSGAAGPGPRGVLGSKKGGLHLRSAPWAAGPRSRWRCGAAGCCVRTPGHPPRPQRYSWFAASNGCFLSTRRAPDAREVGHREAAEEALPSRDSVQLGLFFICLPHPEAHLP